MITTFFYGLFMDEQRLRGLGLHPQNATAAGLPDYAIRIGDRATLIEAAGHTAYGMLIALPPGELDALYAGDGVQDYVPEPVEVIVLETREIRSATCYNLPASRLGRERNADYARELAGLLESLGFPAAYVRSVRDGPDDSPEGVSSQ